METETPTVSVIVPFRDVRSYLPRCIESLLRQALPRSAYEVIFVDNASRDGGRELVAVHPEVRLLHEPRPGVYAARNRGLAAARGAILAFTDPDCEVAPDWLERIVATLGTNGVGIVLGHRTTPSESRVLGLITAYESQKAAYVTGRGHAELIFGHANNMAVTRQVMDRVGPFADVQRGGDTVLVRRAVDAYGCAVVRYAPEVEVRHLEMASLRTYYAKSATYGRSNERLRDLVSFRPLSSRERWQVFRDTVRANGWSPLRGALLLAALIPGMLCYEWGRRTCPRRE